MDSEFTPVPLSTAPIKSMNSTSRLRFFPARSPGLRAPPTAEARPFQGQRRRGLREYRRGLVGAQGGAPLGSGDKGSSPGSGALPASLLLLRRSGRVQGRRPPAPSSGPGQQPLPSCGGRRGRSRRCRRELGFLWLEASILPLAVSLSNQQVPPPLARRSLGGVAAGGPFPGQ